MCLHYPFTWKSFSFALLRPSHPLILPKSLHRILLIPFLSIYVVMSKETLFTDKTRNQEHLFLAHLSVFPAWLGISFGPPSVPLGSLYIQHSDVRFLLHEEVWAGGAGLGAHLAPEISLPLRLGSFHVQPCPLRPILPVFLNCQRRKNPQKVTFFISSRVG